MSLRLQLGGEGDSNTPKPLRRPSSTEGTQGAEGEGEGSNNPPSDSESPDSPLRTAQSSLTDPLSSQLPYTAATKARMKLPAFRAELNKYHAWNHVDKPWENKMIYASLPIHNYEREIDYIQNRFKRKARSAAKQFRHNKYIFPKAYPSKEEWEKLDSYLKNLLKSALALNKVMGIDDKGTVIEVYFPNYVD